MKSFIKIFKRDTIRSQLRVYIILFAIFMSLVILIPTLYIEHQQTMSEKYEEIENVLHSQTYFFENWIKERSYDIEMIANINKVRDHDYENAKEYFHKFKDSKTDFSDLVFVNNEGIVQFDTVNRSLEGIIIDVTDRPYFQVAKEEKTEFITDILVSKVTNIPIVIFASPILDDDTNFNGVVFGTVDVSTIDEILDESRVGFPGNSYVVDQKGILLTELKYNQQLLESDPETKGFEQNFIIDDHIIKLSKENRSYSPKIYKDLSGKWVFGSSKQINQGKWYLISEISVMEAYSPFLKKIALILICIIVGTLIAIRFMLYIANVMDRPIQQLLEGVRYIEKGNYDYKIDELKIDTSVKEFRELCTAFNTMSDKVKANIVTLEELSTTCELTQVYNKRYLMEVGEKLFNQSKEFGRYFTCMVIDIDFFKNVNDTHGHIVGDQVLAHVSKVLSDSIRKTDIVTRYGGEEFIVLSPNSNIDDSFRIAERIRKQIEDSPFEKDDKLIRITVSIGVAEYKSCSNVGMTFFDLIACSDKALYEAKEKGRNQIRKYNG